MAYEKQIEDFAETKATWVSLTDLPLLHTKQLVRGWKAVSDAEKATNEAYLNAYVSPKNVSPSTTIADPQADGSGTLEGGLPKNVFTGTWRHVSTAWDRANQLYVQTLREGWASTVLTGTAPNDECMVRTGNDSRSDARSYDFYWRNVAATSVNACVASLRTLGAFTNPYVQGETKTGTFAFDAIVPTQDDDGSYTITLRTLKVATIATEADFADLVPLRRDIRDIENPFGLEGSYTGHEGRKPTEGIALTYRAISVASRAAILALTDTHFQGLLSVAEQAKYEFIKRDLQESEGNTLTLSLVYQYVPLAITTPEASARLVGEVRFNQSGKLALTRSWPRIDPDVVNDLLVSNANSKVLAEVVTDPMADGKTYAGDWLALTTKKDMTANDGLRIVQELIKSGDQKLYTKTGTDPLHLTCEFKLWDAGVVAVEAFLADSNPFQDASVDPKWATPELGITKLVRTEANADRSLNVHAIYSTSADLSRLELFSGTPGKLSVQDAYFSSTERGYGWNIPVSSLKTISDYYKPSPKVVNTKNEFKITRRDEHTFDFDGVLTTFVEVDDGGIVVEDTAEKTVTRRKGEFILAAKLVAGQVFGPVTPQVDGTVIDIDSKENEVGTFTVVRTQTVYHEQSSSANEVKGLVEEVTVASVKANAATPTVETDAVNKSSAVKVVARPDGLKDTEKVDTEKKAKTLVSAVVVEKDAFHTKTLTKKVNATAVDAPATYGKADAAHNGLGGVDTDLVEIVEVNATAGGGRDSLVETIAVEKASSTTSAAATGGAVNVVVDVEEKATPGGKVERVKTTTTKKSLDSTATVAEKTATLDITRQILLNQTSPTAATAVGESVETKPNGAGGWDCVKIKRALASGFSVKTVDNSAVIKWSPQSFQERIKKYSVSTNPDNEHLIGENIYFFYVTRSQKITTSVVRTFSLTMPAAATATASGGSATSEGASVNVHSKVIPVEEGLWCEETTTITTLDWEAPKSTVYWVGFVAIDADGDE